MPFLIMLAAAAFLVWSEWRKEDSDDDFPRVWPGGAQPGGSSSSPPPTDKSCDC